MACFFCIRGTEIREVKFLFVIKERTSVETRHKTGLEDSYVIRNNKKLRRGYTTGSCAAAAAKAAARMLLGKERVTEVRLMTPKGMLLNLEVLDVTRGEDWVSCAIRKDGGDDPDVTNGILVYARVEKRSVPGILLDGGIGVGRVTKPGLEQAVGSAAINETPRQMICREAEAVCREFGYQDGLGVVISIPEGVEAAKKTFNPRLGIEGGISVLGTSGIVEPMSESALIESIRIEMNMRLAQGAEYLLITPGNYGETFLKEQMDGLDLDSFMKCSNFVGETIDMAVDGGVKGMLFVSHIGKFIKVAGGIMNTHSRCADARAELMAAAALHAGAEYGLVRDMLKTITTEEGLGLLKSAGLLKPAMEWATERIHYYLNHRAYDRVKIGAVVFSNEFGLLGETAYAPELKELLKKR